MWRPRLGSGRRRAPENFGLVLVQFPVWWRFWRITLPFISSSPASKGEASREPNTNAPGVRFSFNAPPADGRGLWLGIFSRKFPESSAKERAKVKVHVEGGGSLNLAKKTAQQQSVLRRDSVMLAACLKRLSIKKWSVILWRNLASGERIFIRGVVAQHGPRER